MRKKLLSALLCLILCLLAAPVLGAATAFAQEQKVERFLFFPRTASYPYGLMGMEEVIDYGDRTERRELLPQRYDDIRQVSVEPSRYLVKRTLPEEELQNDGRLYRYGLVDDYGQFILPEEYTNCETGREDLEDLLAFEKAGKYAYYSLSQEKFITAFAYDAAAGFDELGIVGKHVAYDENGAPSRNLYGAVDRQGKLVIPLEYSSLGVSHYNASFIFATKGVAYGNTGDGPDPKVRNGAFDYAGNPIRACVYPNTQLLSAALCMDVPLHASGEAKLKEEELSITWLPQYDWVEYEPETARLGYRIGTEGGIAHLNGVDITGPVYHYGPSYSYDSGWHAYDYDAEERIYLDPDGNILPEEPAEKPSVSYRYDENYGFLLTDERGDALSPKLEGAYYDVAPWNAGEGLYGFVRNGKVGFSDAAGRVVIEPKYDYSLYHSEGFDYCFCVNSLAPIYQEGGGRGFIDVEGNWYDRWDLGVLSADEGPNGKYGYRDENWNLVIPYLFDNVGDFENGYALVRKDGVYGVLKDPTAPEAATPFLDVAAGSWYESGVKLCAERGVMVGTGEALFSPSLQLSAPECLTLALRLYDLRRGGDGTLEKAPADAKDLPAPDKWYRDAVYTAYQWRLGDADGFDRLVEQSAYSSVPGPTDRITFARALAVAAGELEKKFDVPRIPDLPPRSEYNKGVYSLYEAGILGGTDSFGTFQESKELTRAECAVMVARVLDPTQRLSAPPAVPNGYEQAVIDLRGKLGYYNEQRLETDVCTIFIYDRGGFMNAPTGAMTVIYKPGSQPGDGYVLDLPHAWVKPGLAICYPADTMTLSADGKTFTYTYYREQDLGEPVQKAGTITYTVDLPTGEIAETWAPHGYATSLAHVTRKRGGVSLTEQEVVQTLEAPDCTAVLTKSSYGKHKDYTLSLVYKPGSALGDGVIKRLILPSTVPAIDYSKYRPTNRSPDSLGFSEDGKTLTYTYYFTEALTDGDTVLHEAGEYIYTANLTTGEVTARIDPASQRDIAYYSLLDSLKTEEGYKEEYSYHNYGTFQLPDGVETVLRCKAAGDDPDKRDYEFYLVRRDAQPQLLRLPLPSTELLPDGSAPTTREPDSVKTYSDPNDPTKVTLAYSYRFTEQLWNGDILLHDKGTYTYTVDTATGEQSVVLEDSYWKALADVTRNTDDRPFQPEQQLESELCTVVLGMTEAIQHPIAVLALVYKPGSPLGAGEVVHLPTLSGSATHDSLLPHSISLNEEKTVLTYEYQFDEDFEATRPPGGFYYVAHAAGTYTYTVDLATGEVTDTFAPKE